MSYWLKRLVVRLHVQPTTTPSMSENAKKINISQWSEGGSIPKKLIKIY